MKKEILSLYTKNKRMCIKDVIEHYNKLGRYTLPWRKNITPYRVLVSEIMLQQTQVSRVTPKFIEWMKRYPTLATLNEASLKDIFILWQGLGYQRRAKALLSIARENTSVPKTFDELLKLPGVGTYTASAVCAFAYNQFSHPVLETNIRTVLIEYFHQNGESVSDSTLYEDLFYLEEDARIRSLGAREWYYALMDYGAHLKEKNISHNKKSAHYKKQTPYKGSTRELRAKILFAIMQGELLPKDERISSVLTQLIKEGYIVKKKGSYILEETS